MSTRRESVTRTTNPTVRALNELKQTHERECNRIREEDLDSANHAIASVRANSEKEAVVAVAEALRNAGIPFVLVTKDICKIRQDSYDGNLKISLAFTPEKVPELKKAISLKESVEKTRGDAKARLEKWYTESLYKIASRLPVDYFKV